MHMGEGIVCLLVCFHRYALKGYPWCPSVPVPVPQWQGLCGQKTSAALFFVFSFMLSLPFCIFLGFFIIFS